MSTIIGTAGDDEFFLRSGSRSVTVDGAAGNDFLEVDWSDKSRDLVGRYDDRSGAPEAFIDDIAAGVVVNAIRVERLLVRFGSGDDRFELGGGAVADLEGGAGTDILRGDFRGLTTAITFALDQAAGATSVIVGQGSTVTDFERVQLFTGAGNDDLAGGAGVDVLSAGGGNNRLAGGGGDDQLLTAGGVNTILGGDGTDRWSGDYRESGTLRVTQEGAAAYALSDGSTVSDVEIVELSLGGGDDTIELGRGASQIAIDAGAGTDQARVDWSSTTASVSGFYNGALDQLELFGAEPGERITLDGIERFDVAFGAGDDRFSMTAPLAGTFDGGAGSDYFYADVSASSFSVSFAVNSTAGETGATINDTVVRNVEQVELRTGSGDDRLTGGGLDDRFFAGEGFDTIRGGGGSDTIFGGAGDDLIDGGGGADLLYGEAGIDTVSYASARAGVTVDLSLRTAQQTGGAGIDLIDGFENLTGSVYDDTLSGNGRDNEIVAGGGNDRVNASAGNDSVDGGRGDDALIGGSGNDKLYGDAGNDDLAGGLGDDELFGSFGDDTLGGGDGADYLEGFDGADVLRGDAGSDFIDGGNGSDLLVGGAGTDRLFGGAGADRLIGGEGADTLFGDAGADRFIFADGDVGVTAATADVAADFSQAERDRIDLRAIDADTTLAGDQAFAFIGTAAFSSSAGELRYEQDAAGLFLQGDMDGNGAADFFIRIENVQIIAAGDLLV
jgi:Ca2+-binding RTX toxin-like protein